MSPRQPVFLVEVNAAFLLGAMESLYKAGYFMQVLLCITLFHNIPQ